MGRKQSKEAPAAPEEKDERWDLARSFGPKYHEFAAKIQEIKASRGSVDEALPRPIHSSVYWRLLPVYQSWWFHLALIGLFFRKLPFTNPLIRLYFFGLGIDFCRGRIKWNGIVDHEDIKEAKCFDLMFFDLTRRTGVRVPDFKDEWRDWYEMNKPAYRVPIPHEYAMDSWMRFFLFNMHSYKLRPTKWHGEWEQEMCLNMDLHAPHADHWLDIH